MDALARFDDVVNTARRHGLDVDITVRGVWVHVPSVVIDDLLRALDTALSDVLRRDEPVTCLVTVHVDRNSIELNIGVNGSSMAPEPDRCVEHATAVATRSRLDPVANPGGGITMLWCETFVPVDSEHPDEERH